LAASDYPPLSFVALVPTYLLSVSLGEFAALKATIFGFQLLSTAMIWAVSRNPWLTVAFNVAVILSGISLGYIDIFFAPTLIGAVWALRASRLLLSAFLLGVTCLTKWQPLLIVPFMIIYILQINTLQPRAVLAALGTRRFGQLVALAGGMGIALFGVFGSEPLIALSQATKNSVFISADALNLGWLEQFSYRYFIEGSTQLADQVTFIKEPDRWVYRVHKAMFYLTYITTLFCFVRSAKTLANLLFFTLTGYLCYVTLAPGVHENHAFLLLLLGMLLAGVAPSGVNYGIAALTATMANVNLFLFYGLDGALRQPRGVGLDLTVPIALLFVLIWLCFMREAMLRAWSPHEPDRPADADGALWPQPAKPSQPAESHTESAEGR